MQPIRGGPKSRGPFKGPVFDNNGTGEIPRAPLYVCAPWKSWTAPDIFPNLACLVVLAAHVAPAPVEPTFTVRPPPQIDQFVNVAIREGPESPLLPRAMIEPTIGKRWASFDQAVNVAALAQPPAYQPRAFIDPFTPKRLSPQVDLYPNIAVGLQTVMTPQFTETTATRVFARAPDLYPNIAVNFQTVMTPQFLDVPPRRALTQVDLYPNLAVLAPVAQIPLIAPVEPWIAKRYPPQIDVYPNPALYAPVDTVLIRAPIDPTLSVRYPPMLIEFPNLAVNFVQPAPPVTPPPQSGGGLLPGRPPYGDELGRGLGPHKRPGQVFGEPDPISPYLTSAAPERFEPPKDETPSRVDALVAMREESRTTDESRTASVEQAEPQSEIELAVRALLADEEATPYIGIRGKWTIKCKS